MRHIPTCFLPVTILGAIALTVLPETTAFSSGAPAGVSGAPGEATCVVCHGDFPLNSGTAGFHVTAPPALVGTSPVTIEVAWSRTTTPRHGFMVTVRDSADRWTGVWTVTDPANTRHPFGSTEHVTHTSAGNALLRWSMEWNPPSSAAPGPFTIYAAGNEANGNFATSGDRIYTTSTKVYRMQIATPQQTWPLGTAQPIALHGATHPNETYVIALSDDPTPTSIGWGLEIPVDLSSPFFPLAFQLPTVFQGWFGTLDATGQGNAHVLVPPIPALSGLTLYAAFATFDSGALPTEVSNPIRFTLL